MITIIKWLRYFTFQYSPILLLVSVLSLTPAIAKNAPASVSIPMPDGSKMNFKAVYLGLDGNQLFDSRSIQLGSREPNPNYKEQLIETRIAGAFIGDRNGKKDWLYYMAESEIQVQHWNAIMRWADEQEGISGKNIDDNPSPNHPKTRMTLSEIHRFIEYLNKWMLSQQSSSLPQYGNANAFARLPLESEWAFAARGGIETVDNPDVFDRPHPYEKSIGEFEWFRENSGNEVQVVASEYIKPNPIGLYDMLGNVKELTLSLFGPEYQFGRFGHITVRGGDYSSSEKTVAASKRMEFAPYNDDGSLRRSQKIGIRLVLSSPISASTSTPQEIDRAFEKYTKSHALSRPGPVGSSSPASQSFQDLIEDMKRREAALSSENDALKSKLLKADSRVTELADNIQGIEEGYKKELLDYKQTVEVNSSQCEDKSQALINNKGNEDIQKLKNINREMTQELANLTKNLKRSEEEYQDVVRKIKDKDKRIEDLERRDRKAFVNQTQDVKRVRAVEKRLLEALMRQASANAAIAYRQLAKIENQRNIKKALGKKINKKDEVLYIAEATDMLEDYWLLIKQIVTDTDKNIFNEVKDELTLWLEKHEKQGSSEYQRKSLDLIKRHVLYIRQGNYERPKNFVSNFINEKEFK